MIQDGFSYLAAVTFIAALVVAVERKSKASVFKVVPAVVVIYLGCMLLSTAGLWLKTDSVNATYKAVKNAVLPAMIFLMLLRCDLRKIVRLGPKMITGFIAASISIGLGFIVTYLLFEGWYEADTWKSFAALCGSWMGGTGNMVAIQGALDIPDGKMVHALLMDSVDYAVWVMLLLSAVPYAGRFNAWARADTSTIDAVGAALAAEENEGRKLVEFPDLMVLTGLSLGLSALAWSLASMLPVTTFLTRTTWAVLLATAAGTVAASTAVGKLPGSSQLANVMLYVLVALIASRADFTELARAPLYIASGFVILLVHAVFMLVFARLLHLDLFTCGVASLANIGGVASAPILAAAYSEVLVPVGVLMAMIGYVIGTGGGLLVGKILSML